MYRIFARLYPRFLKENIKALILYSNIKIKEEEFTGLIVISSFCLALLMAFLIPIFEKFAILSFIVFFIIFQFLYYIALVLMADKKAKFVENILPDCLQLTASNLRAGFTTERAFLLSARPEFGFFAEELTLLGKKIASGKSLESAMLDMTKKIKSDKFQKTFSLIIRGVDSGGELASLLSQTAQNLRNQEIVEAKIRASVYMYFIFIFTAICFAAPILFGLSSFLVEVITTQIPVLEVPTGIQAPIQISRPEITLSFVIYFVVAILVTLCISGSLILGSIKGGGIKSGLKYIPILLMSSLGLFFIIRTVIRNVFSFFI